MKGRIINDPSERTQTDALWNHLVDSLEPSYALLAALWELLGPSGAKTQSETKNTIVYCVLSAKMKRATISLQSGEGDIDFDW